MRVKNKYGFINERGSYNLDFNDENESKTFMVSCIVVNENQLEQLNTESSFIVKDFLKADNLIDEDLKWTMKKVALKDLSHLDIEIFIFLVKKERLKEEYGIKDKESFLEFLNGILYTDIIAAYPHIKLISDELIEKEFLKEFDKYLIEKHSPDLLGEYDVVFVDEEKEYSFLDIGSFISDILFNKYEGKSDLEEYEQCYEIIREKVLPLASWPRTPEEYMENLQKYIREEFDEDIAYNSIRIAFDFISNNGGTKNEAKYAQVLCLKYLLSILLNYGENRYVFSEEIRKNLSCVTGREFTPHYFQARIIAPLRDSGILIATRKKGYKIPIRESEILSFINQSSSVIKPMVERIKICRDSVLKATHNKVDVLNNDEYKYLKEIINIEGHKVLK